MVLHPELTIVLSIDAMTRSDLEQASALPAFSRLLQNCALAESVRSAYPSLTYPCHVSMVTGCWPDRTGVVNNEHFLPLQSKRPWYFYTDEIRCPTIFHFARQAGVSTGCVMWPCMGRGPIDYLVPEIWGKTPDSGFYEPFCEAGSPALIQEIWDSVGRIPHGFAQPEFDRFAFACGMEVLRRKAPQLLYLHICQVDNAKHHYGLHSPQAAAALERTNGLIGQLLDYLDGRQLTSRTAILLCSDHGQVPVHTVSYPNLLLRERGLIQEREGAVTQWKIQSHSACCSAQIYAADEHSAEMAYRLFTDPDVQNLLGIAQVYTKPELRERFHLDGSFVLQIEGKPGVLFRDELSGAAYTVPMEQAGLPYLANHGHEPSRSDSPFFLLSGPGIRPGARLASADLVDEPATAARLCQFSMPDIQGRVLSELLL